MPRLFVAIEIPAGPKQALARARAPWRGSKAVRWAPLESLHLTVAFLGDIAPDAVPGLVGTLNEVASRQAPFELVLDGFGTFPPRGPPRVLWIGVKGAVDRLEALAGALDVALAPYGFLRDHPFSPHVTLGRVKGDVRPIVGALSALSRIGTLRADSVILFQSELTGTVAIHTPLATCPLGAQIPSG